MRWVAAVRSHGNGEVDSRFPIGSVFDAINVVNIGGKFGRAFDLEVSNKMGDHTFAENYSDTLNEGNWDLYQVPDSKEEYVAEQAKCGIEAGDRVRVIRPFKTDCYGFTGTGITVESCFYQKECTVQKVASRHITMVSEGFYPYFCLEKVGSAQEAGDEAVCRTVEALLNPPKLSEAIDWDRIENEARRINGTPKRKETIMKLTKNWWKKYKLVAVVVFSMWWIPTVGKVTYPMLVQLGVVIDKWFMMKFGGEEVAPCWGHYVLAVICVVAACAALWGVKKALAALYKTM